MAILQLFEVVVILMPYFRSIAMHAVCGYCTNMKLISRGFQYVSAKYKYLEWRHDNNNKHLVTAFEEACRNIIELPEHLNLAFSSYYQKVSIYKIGIRLGPS